MSDSWLASLTDEQKARFILVMSPEVYFIRCEQFIKIGVSQDPRKRVKQIRKGNGGFAFPAALDINASELIATELGGFERERELHAKFAHLRHTGEWFTEAPELTEYIEYVSERKSSECQSSQPSQRRLRPTASSGRAGSRFTSPPAQLVSELPRLR